VEEGREEGGFGMGQGLPNRVWDMVLSGGRCVRGAGQRPSQLLRREGGIGLIVRQTEEGGRGGPLGEEVG